MRTIPKGPQPTCLTAYQAAARNAVPRPQFKDITGLCKDEVRRALVRDQGGVCCYCMDRIRPDRFSMKVAHWQSQHLHPDRIFDFSNLFGACLGGEKKPEQRQHCDTFQRDRDFHTRLDHPTMRLEHLVRYARNGRISAPDNPDLDRELNEILNLNEEDLCRKREAVLAGLLGAMRRYKGAWSATLIAQQRNEWSTPGPEGFKCFYGVVLEFLDRRA